MGLVPGASVVQELCVTPHRCPAPQKLRHPAAVPREPVRPPEPTPGTRECHVEATSCPLVGSLLLYGLLMRAVQNVNLVVSERADRIRAPGAGPGPGPDAHRTRDAPSLKCPRVWDCREFCALSALSHRSSYQLGVVFVFVSHPTTKEGAFRGCVTPEPGLQARGNSKGPYRSLRLERAHATCPWLGSG